MALQRDHELHQRRFSRNVGLGAALLVFVVLVFGLTIVKVSNLGIEAAPHAAEALQ